MLFGRSWHGQGGNSPHRASGGGGRAAGLSASPVAHGVRSWKRCAMAKLSSCSSVTRQRLGSWPMSAGACTGKPGACYGTFGPGATNLTTGVGCSYLDHSPLLAFTTEARDTMRHRTMQMWIDHQALFKPLTKWTTTLHANDLLGHLRACRAGGPCQRSPGRSTSACPRT